MSNTNQSSISIIVKRLISRYGLVILVLVILGGVAYFLDAKPDVPGYVKTAPAGNYTEINWNGLMQGTWATGQKPRYPESVAQAGGKTVKLRGFITPFHQPGKSSTLFLTNKPRGCYFCNPPGVSEVAMIKVAGGKELEIISDPVVVYGKFIPATGKKTDESLYVIDNAQLMIDR